MMRVPMWSGIATLTLGLALLSLVGQSQAGLSLGGRLCCICNCAGVLNCAQTSPEGCLEFCTGGSVNHTGCLPEFVNGSCAEVPQCPEEQHHAPVVGNTGLTVVALALAALGVVGLRRAARRKRA